jgi:hypothetical protein
MDQNIWSMSISTGDNISIVHAVYSVGSKDAKNNFNIFLDKPFLSAIIQPLELMVHAIELSGLFHGRFSSCG